MTRKIKIVTIGDLHIGAVPPEQLEREFEVVFATVERERPDAVVQLGDWLDKRLSLDSEDSKLSMRLAVRMCQLCSRIGAKFRIIRGTLSHDFFQLDNLLPLETEYPVFRIVTTAAHEELLEGFDVLWMPEEYPTDYEDFYGRLLFGQDEEGGEQYALVYDAIFGHGEIDVAANYRSIEGEKHYVGAPLHSSELLLAHSSGPVEFGHIHPRFRYKRRLGYPGSFSRWCQGEEAPKGFNVLELTSLAEGGWEVGVRVVANELARVYRKIDAAELWDMTMTTDQMVARAREFVEANGIYRMRVVVGAFPLGVEELAVVRGALVDDHRIEIQSTARIVAAEAEPAEGGEALSEEAAAAQAEERRTRFAFLRNHELPGEARLLQYMQETGTVGEVTIEDVRELTAPLTTG